MADKTKKIIFQGEDAGVQALYERIGEAGKATGATLNDEAKKQNQELERLVVNTEDYTRTLISQAREYSTSSKEVLGYIEEQIKAEERRQGIEKTFQTRKIEGQYKADMESAGGDSSKEKEAGSRKSASLADLDEGSKVEQLQTTLLRELIETVKQTSKSEIREDRQSVIDSLEADETVNRLGLSEDEDEFDALKKTIQQGEIGNVTTSEREQQSRFSGRGVEDVSNKAAQIGTMPNELYMLAAAAALIPIIGNGSSQIMTKLLNSAEGYEGGLKGMAQIGGGGFSPYKGMGMDTSSMGFNAADFLKRGAGLARARGTMSGIENATNKDIALERGFGLGEGELGAQARLTRSGGGSSTEVTQQLIKGLRASGAMKGDDASLLPEFFTMSTNIAQEQLQVLGEIDTGINTKLITKLTQNDIFKNPEILKSVIAGLSGGLTGSKTPQIEALQLATLSRLKPGASLFDLEKMQEGGLQTEGYLTGMLKTLKQTSFGKDEFSRNIANTFGLSNTLSETLGEDFDKGNLDEGAWAEKMGGAAGISAGSIKKRAQSATGTLEAATKNLDNTFATYGERLVDAMKDLADIIDKNIGGTDEATQIERRKESDKARAKEYENAVKTGDVSAYSENRLPSTSPIPVVLDPTSLKSLEDVKKALEPKTNKVF